MTAIGTFTLYRGPYDGATIEGPLAADVDAVSLAFAPAGDVVGDVIPVQELSPGTVIRFARYAWTITNIDGNAPKKGEVQTRRLVFTGFDT
jgi:hypothetical protein